MNEQWRRAYAAELEAKMAARRRACAVCRRSVGPRGGVMAQRLAPHMGMDGKPCPGRQPGTGATEPWRGYRCPPAFWPSRN